MGNPFRWVELTTDNMEQAKEFYSQLFEWEMEPFGKASAPYLMVDTGGDAHGGIMNKPSTRTPTTWTPYVQVDDLTAVCGKVELLGGRILKQKTAVPGMGWYAVIHDPQGAVIGLWQQRKE